MTNAFHNHILIEKEKKKKEEEGKHHFPTPSAPNVTNNKAPLNMYQAKFSFLVLFLYHLVPKP